MNSVRLSNHGEILIVGGSKNSCEYHRAPRFEKSLDYLLRATHHLIHGGIDASAGGQKWSVRSVSLLVNHCRKREGSDERDLCLVDCRAILRHEFCKFRPVRLNSA